jgi:5S rRNA maturation endonuclease (ribonuclease M5)
MNSENGLWICYSCGARGTLNGLVRELTGKEDLEVSAMLMNNSVDMLLVPKVEQETPADIHTYLSYPPVPSKYLRSRNLSSDAARMYGIRWNETNLSWIIPIVSPDNELLGWQEKAPDWVRNHPRGIKMRHTLFGIERFTSKTSILVESPLDVVRFASSFDGMQCLATFGASITTEQLRLLYGVSEKVIVALDNDKAGIESAKKLFKDMPALKGGMFWLKYSHTKAKDLGDMTDDEIEQAIMDASVIPWWI